MKDNKDKLENEYKDNKKREIEFRAKNINDQWRYGYLERQDLLYDENYDCSSSIQIETLGQYTGLKDRNGKKIYEGDIVEFDEKEWGCKYYEEVKWDYELLDLRKSDYKQWCVVVGNIYDNPELLGR